MDTEQKSRSKIILEELCKTPYILNIRWSKNNRVFVDMVEETPEGTKEHIRRFLLLMCDKYEVVFRVVKKKKWWQKFLEKLKWPKK